MSAQRRRSWGSLPGLALGAGLLFACGHAHRADDTAQPAADGKDKDVHQEQKRDDKPARSAKAREGREEASARKSAGDASPEDKRESSAPPLATGPEGLMAPGAVEKVQQRLRDRGLLHGKASGHWDEPSRAALRAFQRDNGLPATGIPDDVTVGKLGLAPEDVFRAAGQPQ